MKDFKPIKWQVPKPKLEYADFFTRVLGALIAEEYIGRGLPESYPDKKQKCVDLASAEDDGTFVLYEVEHRSVKVVNGRWHDETNDQIDKKDSLYEGYVLDFPSGEDRYAIVSTPARKYVAGDFARVGMESFYITISEDASFAAIIHPKDLCKRAKDSPEYKVKKNLRMRPEDLKEALRRNENFDKFNLFPEGTYDLVPIDHIRDNLLSGKWKVLRKPGTKDESDAFKIVK